MDTSRLAIDSACATECVPRFAACAADSGAPIRAGVQDEAAWVDEVLCAILRVDDWRHSKAVWGSAIVH